MGFFSWDCRECGHSIRADASVNAQSAWMNEAVAQTPNGSVIFGGYDGYGCVGSIDLIDGRMEADEFALHHRVCWELARKPAYLGPSRSAADQGYFVDDYDPQEPKTVNDVRRLKALAEAERERLKAERDAARARGAVHR